jgi:hypothetical protein
VHYISFQTYSYQAFMINEFQGNRTFECPCAIMPGGCGGPCRYSGEQVLAQASIPDRSFAFLMGMLTVMVAGYRILFALALTWQEVRRRGVAPRPVVAAAAAVGGKGAHGQGSQYV